MTALCITAMAQGSHVSGTINKNIHWTFDGQTLTIKNENVKVGTVSMPDYDNLYNMAPWLKKKLGRDIRRVTIGKGIGRIGACAFYGCKNLTDVEFATQHLTEIGWGAFMDCSSLHNISFPPYLKKIETVAFANCSSIPSLNIPDQCRVENQAFVSCTNIKSLNISPTALIGTNVFAKEDEVDGVLRHSLYNGELRRLPAYINTENCNEYGLAKPAVEKYYSQNGHSALIDYDELTSDVDKKIPASGMSRNDTYALIIGNQNYRFNSSVPYAIHDARVFKEYCEKTLGIPSLNIHICEDATKTMINEEEFNWLEEGIEDRSTKKLIVYYAGHGVPDAKDKNKAYIVPTDVRGTTPKLGIALSDFYSRIGDLGFMQATILMDACFSGINRDNGGVNDGLRGVAMEQEEVPVMNPALLVISAAQGNETAQGYTEQGHGLFTYFVLKEIQNSNGQISMGSLSDNVTRNVRDTAPSLQLRKSQTPTTNSMQDSGKNWRNWTF